MNTIIRYTGVVVCFILLCPVVLYPANPIIHSVTPNSTQVAKFEKFELTVNLTATYNAPWDYSEVSLKCLFTSPSGNTILVDGFYFQDYVMNQPNVLTPSGNPTWKIRFSPNETGIWTYLVSLTDMQGAVSYPAQQFTCTYSSRKGFVRREGERLRYGYNETFVGIGTNLAWQWWEDGFTEYGDWIEELAAQNGNFTKITTAPWSFEIEWKNTGAGHYLNRQDRAWALDWIFDKLMENRVYCQFNFMVHLVLEPGGPYGWEENPYNINNGGPSHEPQNFFVNTTSKSLYKRKMRYINARWGYSPYLHSWEILSEADNTGIYDDFYWQTYDWLTEMSEYIKDIDRYNRPVSSGYAIPQHDPNYWNHQGTDFTQLHLYDFISDLEMKIYNFSRWYGQTYGKPFITGEFALGHVPEIVQEMDPNGIAFHNSLWTSAFSGAFGTAMSWWWGNYLYPAGMFSYFNPIGTFFKETGINPHDYEIDVPLTTSSTNGLLEIRPDYNNGNSKAPENQFHLHPGGYLSPPEIRLGEVLHGSVSSMNKNPPTFYVNYTKPGTFKVRTDDLVLFANLRIKLNGTTVLDQSATANHTYSINVPAGEHQIYVQNTGFGVMEIDKYMLDNYSPHLRVFAMKKEDHVAGWMQNRQYNWEYVGLYGNPPKTIDGKIYLTGLTPGIYRVDWFNGEADFDSIQYIPSDETGILALDAPDILWDGLFEATFHSALEVNFAATPQNGDAPLSVQFTDLTNSFGNTITTWQWTFGDGGTSSQKNPQHVYQVPGNYSVSLKVTSGQHQETVTKTSYITVEQAMVADFTAVPLTIVEGDEVQFTDLSLGNPISWFWNFGDQTFSAARHPVHTYDQAGFYDVSLLVSKPGKADQLIKPAFIEVLVPLVADFSADTTLVIAGNDIQFIDHSTGDPVFWFWDFGNGTTANSQNPSVVYEEAGVYTVQLIVFSDHQQDTLVLQDYITVFEPLMADFSTDSNLLVQGDSILFTDVSTGNPTSWIWQFGDGSVSTQQNPWHAFNQPGTFDVTLYIENENQTDSIIKTDYITVLTELIADFEASVTLALPGDEIQFSDQSEGNPEEWLWEFGNGETSSLQHPALIFNEPGVYNVKLTIWTAYQVSSVEYENYITILEPLHADFSVDTQLLWTGHQVQFNDISLGNPTSWSWNFGDGTVSSVQNPLHHYDGAGTYSVILTIADTLQTSLKSKQDYITVRDSLDAEFAADTTIIVKGDRVYFTDLSKGSPQSWFWLFGDGFYSLSQNPSHKFKSTGQFTVSLEIFSNDSSNKEVKQNYIEVLPELNAGFNTDTTLAFPGKDIHFYDTSRGNPTSWFWSFGNYSNSTIQNPVISYDAPGTYTVSLVVSTAYQQDTIMMENLITILEPLVADFEAGKYAVKIGEQVNFYDLSTGSPAQWEWWTGNNDTSYLQNPSAVYFDEGFKDVSLIINNQYAADTLHRDDLIYVIPPTFNQVVVLKKGWSGISSYIAPVFPDIQSVLSDVINDVHFAVNEQGVLWPDMNINTLGNWNPALGLTIDMKNDTEVTISGYSSLENSVDLNIGWNIFPVLRPCDLSTDNVTEMLDDQFRLVKEIGGYKIYWPEMGISSLETLQSGKSYLILMNQPASLSFPSCSE